MFDQTLIHETTRVGKKPKKVVNLKFAVHNIKCWFAISFSHASFSFLHYYLWLFVHLIANTTHIPYQIEIPLFSAFDFSLSTFGTTLIKIGSLFPYMLYYCHSFRPKSEGLPWIPTPTRGGHWGMWVCLQRDMKSKWRLRNVVKWRKGVGIVSVSSPFCSI